MKNNILIGVVCLLIGLMIGFYAANKLNSNAATGQNPGTIQPNGTLQDPKIDNVIVKDQTKPGGQLPEITQTLEKAKKEPGNFDAQTEAGDLYLKIKNFPKALEFFEAAHKIKPDNYELIVKIGNSYFDSNQFEKAGDWYSKALEKQPEDVNVRTDLGITFVEREKSDLDRAIKEFQTSLQKNPKSEPTIYNLAIAFYKQNKMDEAKNTAKKLEEVNPQSELLSRLNQIIK